MSINLEHEIIELKVKYNVLEQQHKDIKQQVSDLKQDFDKRFDEFEKQINSRFDAIMLKLEALEQNKNQVVGGWKAFAFLGALILGIVSIGKFVIDLLKP